VKGKNSRVISEKLACLVNYLERVMETPPIGDLTFSRRAVRQPPAWDASTTRVDGRALRIERRAKIEDVGAVSEVDFANKFVGGSVVSGDSAAQVTSARRLLVVKFKLFS